MSEHRQEISVLWKGPAVAFLGLLVLFALTLASAYWPLGIGNIAINLAVAAGMLGILVTVLMDLRNATALFRLTAGIGVVWLVIMFALILCDYLSRSF
jgi:cytochrome c oxidase subunit 4